MVGVPAEAQVAALATALLARIAPVGQLSLQQRSAQQYRSDKDAVMKVSVVVPVYNKAPWLEESFASIFAQTFQDFEVIAVDDRSTDGSMEILRRFDDPRLRVVQLERNMGPAGAAQRAMDLATGEYVVRMDADDVMLPDRLARQVAFMDADPGIGASGGHQIVLGSTTDIMRASLTDEECRSGVLFQIPLFQPASIYRRSVLVEHGVRFLDDWPRYGEDWWFQARLLRVTRVGNIDAPLVQYRVGPQNIRAGHDRTSMLRTLFGGLFAFYKWPVSEEGLRAHLHVQKWFPEKLNAEDVRKVAAHLRWLSDQNKLTGTFPDRAFDQWLRRAWTEFGYRLPRFGLRVMKTYVNEGPWPSMRQLRYMVTSWATGRA
jgi:glycosyltransferase involved in cell wall biosynthesis